MRPPTVTTGAALPSLAWEGVAAYDPAFLLPITNRPDFWIKPLGGLWTSPHHPDGRTHWVQWCIAEEYADPDLLQSTIIIPDRGATVVVIDDLDDLLAFAADCPLPTGDPLLSDFWPPLDWEKAATRYDAVFLTEAGEWRTRHSRPSLNGWDCASVLWLQPRFRAGG